MEDSVDCAGRKQSVRAERRRALSLARVLARSNAVPVVVAVVVIAVASLLLSGEVCGLSRISFGTSPSRWMTSYSKNPYRSRPNMTLTAIRSWFLFGRMRTCNAHTISRTHTQDSQCIPHIIPYPCSCLSP
jgi:hypothetical protein